MTVAQIRELHESGLVEIAGHGHLHKNTIDDITLGRSQLIEMLRLPQDCNIGFASPGSGMTPDYIRNNIDSLKEKGFAYFRTGLEIKTKPFVRVYARKAARVLHWGWLYTIAYKDTLQDSTKDGAVLSVPIMRDTSLSEIKSLIRCAERKKLICTLMFHSVLASDQMQNGDTWCYDAKSFKKLADWLCDERKCRKLDVLSSRELIDYQNK